MESHVLCLLRTYANAPIHSMDRLHGLTEVSSDVLTKPVTI